MCITLIRVPASAKAEQHCYRACYAACVALVANSRSETRHMLSASEKRACICSAGNAISTTMTLSRDNCYKALRATATEHGYPGGGFSLLHRVVVNAMFFPSSESCGGFLEPLGRHTLPILL